MNAANTPAPLCPKWATCSAPYCPLDPTRSTAITLRGEASCRWLREAVKDGGHVPEQLREPVAQSLRLVLSGAEGGAALRKALKRAESSASKAA